MEKAELKQDIINIILQIPISNWNGYKTTYKEYILLLQTVHSGGNPYVTIYKDIEDTPIATISDSKFYDIIDKIHILEKTKKENEEIREMQKILEVWKM